MRRITLWLMSTLSALLILLSYPTSLPSRAGQVVQAEVGTPVTTGTGSTSAPPIQGAAEASTDATASAAPSVTVTGDTVQTRYGPVEVQVTVGGDQITDVQVLQVPWSNGRDQQINARAVPILIQETTETDGADIQMVSGATYTSDGYVESLQSALDQL